MTAEWETLGLDSEAVSVKSGFAFAKSRLAQSGTPHLRPFNIGIDGELDESSIYYLPSDHGLDLVPYALEPGDVLFNNTSSVEIVGKSALVREPLAVGFSNHVTRLRVIDSDRLRPEWLLLCLRSLWAADYFERAANRWIGQAGFAPTRLKDVHIPLPPPDMQDALIAEYVETTAEGLEALGLLETTTGLAEKLLPSLLARVSAELPAARRCLGDAFSEPVRNGWSPVCDNSEGGTAVLSLGAVLGFQYQPRAVKRTSLPVDPNAPYWLKPGDLLISRSNTAELVGHAAIYSGDPDPCIYPDLLMRLRFDPNQADVDFVSLWLQSPEVRAYIRTRATGASPTMKKINQSTVKNIPFPELHVDDQRRIAERIRPIIDELERARNIVEQTKDLVSRFDRSLLRSLIPVVEPSAVAV